MRLAVLAAVLVAGSAVAGEMNISQFVFRDSNRNGVFDAGESPYAGIPIRLEQEGAEPIVEESNLAGFANFPMSADDPGQDITGPGEVRFAVELPDGLVLTTEKPVHAARIRRLDRAPAGLVMEPPNPFMGVAPALAIETSAEGLRAMTCASGGLVLEAVPRLSDLVCEVTQGTWEVTWRREDGATVSRKVTVADWPVRVPAARAAPPAGQARIETFEGVIGSENIQEMAASDGFTWHNLIAVHRKFYGAWGYTNGTISGEFAAYNSSGHPATLSSDEPFEFRSVLVSVAWPAGRTAPVRFTALREGEVVAEEAFFASNLRPVLFEPRWGGIDTLVISHDTYWQVVIDDLTLAR